MKEREKKFAEAYAAAKMVSAGVAKLVDWEEGDHEIYEAAVRKLIQSAPRADHEDAMDRVLRVVLKEMKGEFVDVEEGEKMKPTAKQGRVEEVNPEQLETIIKNWMEGREEKVTGVWFVVNEGEFMGAMVLIERRGEEVDGALHD